MLIQSYNQELQYANVLFMRLFRNISIDKVVGGKQVSHKVKCIYGNRSRVFKNLTNPTKRGMYSYPLIVVTRSALSRDPNRLSNLHNEIMKSTRRDRIEFDLLAPNPINIEYTVTIISDTPSDNDLILGNFVPFFNSDLFVTCKHPKFANLTYNSQIVMSDSITEEHPDELDPSAADTTITTLAFTYKTYIFGGSDRASGGISTKTKIITTIDDDGNEISTEVSSTYDGFVPTVNTLCMEFHAVPHLDVTEWPDIKPYDMKKYFPDLEAGKIPEPAYDVVSWYIDERGIFRNVNEQHHP